MPIMDAKLLLSDAQAITSSASSTNACQFESATQFPGKGTPLFCNVVVNTAFVSSGNAYLTVQLVDSVAGILLQTNVLEAATMVKGFEILKISIPTRQAQTLTLNYSVTSSTFSAGAVDAWIGMEAPTIQ